MLKPILLTLLLLGGMPARADDCGFDAYAKEDYAAALKPLTECAKQGSAGAQGLLGFMYSNGQGVPRDYKAAVRWYTLAAEQGHPVAQSDLGVRYELGQGTPKISRLQCIGTR